MFYCIVVNCGYQKLVYSTQSLHNMMLFEIKIDLDMNLDLVPCVTY